MLLGTIQMSGETLSNMEVMDISRSLDTHTVRLLTLRECVMADREFRCILRSVCRCKSIMQLNLNLGVVSSFRRAEILSGALLGNRSLTSLFLHGSRLGNEGAEVLCRSLCQHPHITSLDLGDCLLGDAAIRAVCDLLPPNGAKPGLHELTLSANPAITSKGWTHFCIALSVCNVLHKLCLDYNNLGDYAVGCLTVALPNCKLLELLDLECTGMTEHGAKLILHLLRNYPVSLCQIILNENKVRSSTIANINTCLDEESDTETVSSDRMHQDPRKETSKRYQDETDEIMQKIKSMPFSGGMVSSENSTTRTVERDDSSRSYIEETDDEASILSSVNQSSYKNQRLLPVMKSPEKLANNTPQTTAHALSDDDDEGVDIDNKPTSAEEKSETESHLQTVDTGDYIISLNSEIKTDKAELDEISSGHIVEKTDTIHGSPRNLKTSGKTET